MEKKHKLINNEKAKRYEFDLDGQKAFIEYMNAPGFQVLTYTEVPSEYAGQGIGQELVAAVLKEVRAKEIQIIPQCGFIASYVYQHPEWSDVVLKKVPGN